MVESSPKSLVHGFFLMLRKALVGQQPPALNEQDVPPSGWQLADHLSSALWSSNNAQGILPVCHRGRKNWEKPLGMSALIV